MGRKTPAPAKQDDDSRAHYFLGDRSWVNLLTNSAFITGVDLREHFAAFFAPGQFPRSCLSSFLHEAVHHWCFRSVVGHTLSILEWRARLRFGRNRLIHLWQAPVFADFKAAFDDVMRFETALALLRPIAEGLALFAQYDVEPRPETQIISRPMQWIVHLFTTPEKDKTKHRLFRPLLVALRKMRMSDASIKAKANLFLEPLRASRSPYLSGYLTVKGMWRLAQRKTDRFLDADLFYMFLRRYFYGDWGLVVRLLDKRRGPQGIARLIEYFTERLVSFAFLDLDAEAELLDRLEQTRVENPAATFNLASTDPKVVKKGQRLNFEAMKFFSPAAGDSEEVRLNKRMAETMLTQRDLMSIGRATVQIEPIKSRQAVRVSIRRKFIAEIQTVKGWKPKRQKGTLTLHISLQGLFTVVALTDNRGKLIAIAVPKDIEDLLGEEIVTVMTDKGLVTRKVGKEYAKWRKDDLLSRYVLDASMLDELERLSNSQKQFLMENSGYKQKYESDIQSTSTAVDEIYRITSLGWADRDKVDTVYQTMAEEGLYPVLNRDPILLNALATLSLASSIGLSAEEAQEHLPPRDMTVSVALQTLEKAAQDAGIPLVHSIDGYLASYV
jgi:hypothetical protein